jgi:N-methylhydantoinase A
VGNDRMAGAIRMVSLARGHDPRDFALFAYGGAGPLHAAALARELGIPRVLIPARPGITNAIGCVAADLRHDYVQTLNAPLDDLDIDEVHAILRAQIDEGRITLDRDGVPVEGVEVRHAADMQFQGQTHILTVALPDAGVTREQLRAAFEEAYDERFAVRLPEIRAVLVNLHTAVIGHRRAVALEVLAGAEGRGRTLDAARVGERPVWFEIGWRDAPVYDRARLPLGAILHGPAVVEQLDATTVIEPGNRVRVDGLGNLLIEVSL